MFDCPSEIPYLDGTAGKVNWSCSHFFFNFSTSIYSITISNRLISANLFLLSSLQIISGVVINNDKEEP